jgi:catechol 2,3-dioxygenase-like lactoylglutathione lyase family enzyme
MTDWFARPLLHVADVEASIRFYVNRLGFSSPLHFGEDGKTFVAPGGAAGLRAYPLQLEAKGAPVKDGQWGYRLLVVDDPDGNQLFFNFPNEPAAATKT